MCKQFLEDTKMLNYKSAAIQKLICTNKWNELDDYEKIKSVYGFVQNEILLGYNCSDILTAEQVLKDGYGQCNTKATLLMALLRGIGIPCRIHGFEVSKDFQRGATTGVISALAPKKIIHTWVEVFYKEQWLVLEGVITDKRYFEAVKKKYPYIHGKFRRFAIATDNFENLSIDWDGNNTYVQSSAIVTDFGVFSNPDEFFEKHNQYLCKVKNFLYVYLGRTIMNYNVCRMRKLVNYPLYCPKCKQETLIDAKEIHVTVIKEPDAQMQSR